LDYSKEEIILEDIKCPFCQTQQKAYWCANTWKYGSKKVQRFECVCGKNFNYYSSGKSSWTIPKVVKARITSGLK